MCCAAVASALLSCRKKQSVLQLVQPHSRHASTSALCGLQLAAVIGGAQASFMTAMAAQTSTAQLVGTAAAETVVTNAC